MNFPIGYGMNAEQQQQAAAEPDPMEAPAEPACPIPKRRRARVRGGRFAADDPATEKDEAWTESSSSGA